MCLALTASVAAGAQTLRDHLLFHDPGNRFSIEFPRDWDWTIVSGSGEPIAVFVHPRKEAAVVVERFRMKLRLEPEDITEVFAEAEIERLQENQRGVAGASGRVLLTGGKRSVVIDYSRPGLGEQERVRQYSFPVGEDLYRITCMALVSRFQRHESAFAAIVGTLKSAEDLAGR